MYVTAIGLSTKISIFLFLLPYLWILRAVTVPRIIATCRHSLVVIVCWLISRKATVQNPGPASSTKQNLRKYFFIDFLSADFWHKILSVNKIVMKSFSKIHI